MRKKGSHRIEVPFGVERIYRLIEGPRYEETPKLRNRT